MRSLWSVSAGKIRNIFWLYFEIFLSRLLTTVGENLDIETKNRLKAAEQKQAPAGIYPLDMYFKDMRRLVSERKTSARVRFLIQDVIELRENNWRKRREDAGPKTIDQIQNRK